MDFQLHDPYILAVPSTKTYYLYTAGGRGVVDYRSKDLLTWEGPYSCFTVPTDSWAAQEGPWAPEVHFYKGKYYLFTTLHNSQVEVPPGGAAGQYTRHMRSTTISVSDSPEGPFTLIKKADTTTPHDFMTLDGTLYVDPDGKPWMVYAHEWVQKADGMMEAIPLKDDLSDAAGAPISLFKASDAPWLDEEATPNVEQVRYVTDGPEVYRSKDGHLFMIWSSYKKSGYVETLARSKSGTLKGPWEQLPTLVENDSGHGMLFKTFDGQLMLCIGQPFNNQRAKIYEMEDLGDNLRVVKFREDLSGPPLPPGAREASQRGGRGGRRGGAGTTPPAASAPAPAATTPAN
jgi:beta-xylosidase